MFDDYCNIGGEKQLKPYDCIGIPMGVQKQHNNRFWIRLLWYEKINVCYSTWFLYRNICVIVYTEIYANWYNV